MPVRPSCATWDLVKDWKGIASRRTEGRLDALVTPVSVLVGLVSLCLLVSVLPGISVRLGFYWAL